MTPNPRQVPELVVLHGLAGAGCRHQLLILVEYTVSHDAFKRVVGVVAVAQALERIEKPLWRGRLEEGGNVRTSLPTKKVEDREEHTAGGASTSDAGGGGAGSRPRWPCGTADRVGASAFLLEGVVGGGPMELLAERGCCCWLPGAGCSCW